MNKVDVDKLSIFECWQLLMREITSPQSFVDMGIYFTVAAACQRRIWTNADHQKLYLNIYPILVGRPGIGKGLVMKVVMEMLKKHKLSDTLSKPLDMSSADSVTAAAVEASDFAKAGQSTLQAPKERLRIPIGPDNGSYESVVKLCAESARSISYKRFDKKLDKIVSDVYRHNSMAFALEELSSFLHKDSKKAVNFLTKAYDCGDYSYTTIGRGEDYIKQVCLCFMAGTTPTFLEEAFGEGILGDGFAARVWYIFAAENRFYKMFSPELTEEQLAARARIEDHILKLTKVYGYLDFTEEARAYLKQWWEVDMRKLGYIRPNPSDKLDSYYERKKVHVVKLASIIHMMEDARMVAGSTEPLTKVTLEETKRAMKVLDELEPNMHYALNFVGANPLAKLERKAYNTIKKLGFVGSDELLLLLWEDDPTGQPTVSVNEVLNHLREKGEIGFSDEKKKWFINFKS